MYIYIYKYNICIYIYIYMYIYIYIYIWETWRGQEGAPPWWSAATVTSRVATTVSIESDAT